MSTPGVLRRSVRSTHDHLWVRLGIASAAVVTPDEPRKGREHVDVFLAAASKHVSAVEAVLLPELGRLPEGQRLVHDYLHAAKHLELALSQAKAHVYGSVFEARHPWESVWAEVSEALVSHRRAELEVVDALAAELDPAALDDLTERLHRAESAAPSRPHPYAPHTGLAGLLTRRIMHAVDSFWDTAEGRMVPLPVRPRRPRPGRFAQYLLADPRFDEDEPRP